MIKIGYWRLLFLVGSILTVKGSYMPWWCVEDLGVRCARSMDLLMDRMNPSDTGGLFIVVLAITVTLLAFFSHKFMWYPIHLLVPGVVTLYLISFYNILNTEIQSWLDRSTASIRSEDGLYVIHLGVLLMMFSAVAIILSSESPTTTRRR